MSAAADSPPAGTGEAQGTRPTGMRTPGLPDGYNARQAAQQLLRCVRAGTLATLGRDGFPFASLVNAATMMTGAPVMLLSGLSAHTKNLMADGRASILLARTGKGDPLAHPRLTVTGTAEPLTDLDRDKARNRFLARHPKSALYADFGDFDFWRLNVEKAHLNGGFAKAAEFDADAILTSMQDAEELEAIEAEALEHMNNDHRKAVLHYAQILLGQKKGQWRAAAIDPEGMDLALGDACVRLPFPEIVKTGAALQKTLAVLAKLDTLPNVPL